MKKILIAVDDTKGTRNVFSSIAQICSSLNPQDIILLYVEKLEGRSLMDEMLGEAEMSTLKEQLEGTEFKEALDRKAEKILHYYSKAITDTISAPTVRTVVRSGHPAEEIIKGADELGVDLIIMGSRGKRVGRLFVGSVSREVANNANVSTLLMR